jgi:F0F1-type ATP synthase membrane subunit c/vacuolar-type H+-ATPase subunit K
MSLEGLRRLGRLSAALSRGVHEPAAIKAATIVPKQSFLGLIFFNIFVDAIAKLCLVLCVLITFTP